MNLIDIYVNCNETGNFNTANKREDRRCENPLVELFRGTPHLRIIEYMNSHDRKALFTVRKIARNIDMNHKNVIKYLEDLDDAGLIEVAYSESNLRLYRLTEKGLLVGENLSENSERINSESR